MRAPAHVLYVEDSPDDRFLVERAMHRARPGLSLSTVTDGDQAVAYLAGTAPYADRARHPLPALLLLDWKLAKRSGEEVLQWVRAQARFDVLPVVVLSASTEDEDMRTAYAAGANSYLAKCGGSAEMADLIGGTLDYWLRLNRRPPPSTDETA